MEVDTISSTSAQKHTQAYILKTICLCIASEHRRVLHAFICILTLHIAKYTKYSKMHVEYISSHLRVLNYITGMRSTLHCVQQQPAVRFPNFNTHTHSMTWWILISDACNRDQRRRFGLPKCTSDINLEIFVNMTVGGKSSDRSFTGEFGWSAGCLVWHVVGYTLYVSLCVCVDTYFGKHDTHAHSLDGRAHNPLPSAHSD